MQSRALNLRIDCSASASAFWCGGGAFRDLILLPIVDARAMFTEDHVFPFAHEVFMLSGQHDVAAAASAVFNRNNNTISLVAQESFIDL